VVDVAVLYHGDLLAGLCVLYPTLGSFQGVLGWSSSGQHAKEVAKADEQIRPLFDKYMKMDLKALAVTRKPTRPASVCT
jgi:hypothetical protein